MAIEVKCPNRDCDQQLALSPEMAGKKGKCPQCGKTFQIPKNLGKSKTAPNKPSTAKTGPKPTPAKQAGKAAPKTATKPSSPPPSKPAPAQPADDVMTVDELSDYLVEEDDPDDLFADDEEPEVVEAVPESLPRRRKRPVAEAVDEVEDYDVVPEAELIEDEIVEVEEEFERPARRRRRPRRRDEDDDLDEEEEDEEDDYAPRAMKHKSAISKTRRWSLGSIGFLIVAISMCVFGGAYVMTMLAEAFMEIGAAADSYKLGKAGATFLKISQVFALLGMIGAITGYSFCIFIPNKHASLGLAIAAVSVAVVNLIFHIIFRMVPILSDDLWTDAYIRNLMAVIGGQMIWDVGDKIFSLFIEFFQYAEFMLFAIFMAAVARMQKDSHHKNDCLRVVWFLSALAGVTLVMYILMMFDYTDKWPIYIIRIMNWAANGLMTIALIFHILNLFHSRRSTA